MSYSDDQSTNLAGMSEIPRLNDVDGQAPREFSKAVLRDLWKNSASIYSRECVRILQRSPFGRTQLPPFGWTTVLKIVVAVAT